MPKSKMNKALVVNQLGPLEEVSATIRKINEANGWYEDARPFSADCALLHSEVSELYEAHRKPGPSDHIPEFSSQEEETADILIRLLDTCARHKFRLAEATAAKLAYNETRGYKHGGKTE